MYVLMQYNRLSRLHDIVEVKSGSGKTKHLSTLEIMNQAKSKNILNADIVNGELVINFSDAMTLVNILSTLPDNEHKAFKEFDMLRAGNQVRCKKDCIANKLIYINEEFNSPSINNYVIRDTRKAKSIKTKATTNKNMCMHINNGAVGVMQGRNYRDCTVWINQCCIELDFVDFCKYFEKM